MDKPVVKVSKRTCNQRTAQQISRKETGGLRHPDHHINHRRKNHHGQNRKQPLLILQNSESSSAIFQIMQFQDSGNQNNILLPFQMIYSQPLRPLIQRKQNCCQDGAARYQAQEIRLFFK